MAKKSAKSTGKQKNENTTKPSSVPTAANPTRPVVNNSARPHLQEKSVLSLPRILFFLSISLLSLIVNNEAPARPFGIFKSNPVASKSPIFVRPRILLVTAHPDDEVLFAPTVLNLLSDEKKEFAELWSLCLSVGDYTVKIDDSNAQNQIATVRKKEWADSWEVLGLDSSRRFILDVP